MAKQLTRDSLRNSEAGEKDVDSLLRDLASSDPATRERARRSLIDKGEQAVPALMDALRHRKTQVRWEAAKALVANSNASAAAPLVGALEDTDAGVRWLAAEALIGLRRDAVPALLRALVDRSDSLWLREGAHHVLHTLTRDSWGQQLVPVLVALEHATSEEVVPVEAECALAMVSDNELPERQNR